MPSSRTADIIPTTGEHFEALVTEEENPNDGDAEVPEWAFTIGELTSGVVEVPAGMSTEGFLGPNDMAVRKLREVNLEVEIWESVQELVSPARAQELIPTFRRVSAREAVAVPIDVFGRYPERRSVNGFVSGRILSSKSLPVFGHPGECDELGSGSE